MEGVAHMSWIEAAVVCVMLFAKLKTDQVAASGDLEALRLHVTEALAQRRAEPGGVEHENRNLMSGDYVVVARPRFKGEVADGKRAKRTHAGTDSESDFQSEAGVAKRSTMTLDLEWDGVMRVLLAEKTGLSMGGVTGEEIRRAAGVAAEGVDGMEAAGAAETVVHGLKLLVNEGAGRRVAAEGGDGGEDGEGSKFELHAWAFGCCPGGPLAAGGDGGRADVFDKLDVDFE